MTRTLPTSRRPGRVRPSHPAHAPRSRGASGALSAHTARRSRVAGTVLMLAVGGAALVVLPAGESAPATSVVAAQSQARPSVVPLPAARVVPRTVPRAPRRASRGGARTALPPLRYVRRTVPVGAAFSGQASWYGGSFQGRRTANGEVFDTNALTAASRTLPFGTRLRVCRLGRCVVVRVNDRGPYVGGRVLDLTRAAVNALGYDGVALVTATPVDSRTVAVRLPAPRPRRSTRPAPRRTTTPAPAPSASPSASPAPADRPVLAAATSPAGQDAPAAVLAGALVVLGAGPVLRARCRRTGS